MNSPSTPSNYVVAQFEIRYTQFIDANGNAQLPLPDIATDWQRLRLGYAWLVKTRAFDKKAVAMQRTGQLGTYAACLGQEAIGTAIGLSLQEQDVFIPAYREYAAQFIRGVPMIHILQYWGGDERGMHYPSGTPAHHDFPLSVPISTHMPHAIGVAYAIKLRGESRVVLASCGDGATSKGDFYEAISAAKIWNLPIVFLVSNNGWAISLPSSRQTGAQTFAQKGIAGGLASEQVDGNDLIASMAVIRAAIERARSGGGPSLIEAITYRLHDHTTADDARRYRSAEELSNAWERCPIKRLKQYLEHQQQWDASQETALQHAATEGAELTAQQYLALAPEAPEAIFDHLYAQLPAAFAAQRAEVQSAGPKGGHH